MTIKEIYDIYVQHPLITTDTRDCPEGSIFLALKGANFDGNKFVMQALEKGCNYAITSTDEFDDPRLLKVEDTLQTFKDLAREHRRRFHGPVIGITGTNGKTTTKELVSAVLQKKYRVLYTLGNFNNDVGVPKTLFRLDPKNHDIAVVEMGANHPGDIKTLVETVEPTCGLITNVGRAHLLGFGSFEGVKATKGELYDNLVARHCPAFLNTTDPDLSAMAAERGIETMPYAKGEVIGCNPYVTVKVEAPLDFIIHTQLIGTYNLPNILAAVTVGRHFGVSDADIKAAIEEYVPQNNRSQLTVTDRNRLVVDAYNANPTSMAAALDNFRSITAPEEKMLILGSMGELGEVSHAEHQKIVEAIRTTGIQKVWLVGDGFATIDHPFRQFADVEEVKAALTAEQPAGLLILIKGSNSQKLFQLPEML